MRLTLVVVVALLFPGCATIQKDGFVLIERNWKTDEAAVRSRAAFDLDCPADSLRLQVISLNPREISKAGQVGVTGCERKVVYLDAYGNGWVANSASEQKSAP